MDTKGYKSEYSWKCTCCFNNIKKSKLQSGKRKREITEGEHYLVDFFSSCFFLNFEKKLLNKHVVVKYLQHGSVLKDVLLIADHTVLIQSGNSLFWILHYLLGEKHSGDPRYNSCTNVFRALKILWLNLGELNLVPLYSFILLWNCRKRLQVQSSATQLTSLGIRPSLLTKAEAHTSWWVN